MQKYFVKDVKFGFPLFAAGITSARLYVIVHFVGCAIIAIILSMIPGYVCMKFKHYEVTNPFIITCESSFFTKAVTIHWTGLLDLNIVAVPYIT